MLEMHNPNFAADPVQQAAGLLLRLMRLYAGVEQARLAARLGVSQPTISRWELGRGGPGEKQLAQWLMLCQVALQAAGRAPFEAAWFNRAVTALQAAYGYRPSSGDTPVAGSRSGDLQVADAQQLAEELRQLGLSLLGASQTNPGVGSGEKRLGSPLTAGRRPLAFLPLYADVQAGLGEAQEARQSARDQLEVPAHILEQDPGAYALRVRGDSMAPLLMDGDAVVVSPAAELYDGCFCAAYVEPDGDVVKRLQLIRGKFQGSSVRVQAENGASHSSLETRNLNLEPDSILEPSHLSLEPEALLLPLNPAYPAIRIGGDSGREARIWGRVVLMLREL